MNPTPTNTTSSTPTNTTSNTDHLENALPKAKVRPLCCVGALVKHQDRFLIVETTKWRGAWGVPGGKVEYGETLQAALEREFLEETGLVLSQIQFAQLQEVVNSSEFFQDAHFILVDFFAQTDTFNLSYNDEIVRHAWVTLEEALSYGLNSFTRTLVMLALERAL